MTEYDPEVLTYDLEKIKKHLVAKGYGREDPRYYGTINKRKVAEALAIDKCTILKFLSGGTKNKNIVRLLEFAILHIQTRVVEKKKDPYSDVINNVGCGCGRALADTLHSCPIQNNKLGFTNPNFCRCCTACYNACKQEVKR